ncbi:MAG TPA: amino acid adenylation domain-containing protein, partial [Longimicrobium sp.]|nr:amino acid adenylation domain-containing protein [Longimicrobium sp.]
MHHIVSDGWSMGVLTRELTALYGAFLAGEADPLPPLPVQYADYAAWQRARVDGEVLRQQAEYWTRTLAGAPELLELPADHARPARQDHAGAFAPLELDEALSAGLRALGQRHGTTLFMTLLAGWAVVLARLSGQTDVVIGTPTANRGRGEIEGLIGFFVNTLALRVGMADEPTVAELLGRVRERALGAQQHQDIPFEQVVDLVQPARSMAHSPLFQVMFAWQNAPVGRLELPGLALEPAGEAAQVTAKFDLSLTLAERGGQIAGGVEYATSLFEAETVGRYLGYLRRVLEEMVADDARSVARLPVLSAIERRRVVEAGTAGEADADESTLPGLFRAQARRTPEAVALVADGEALTYAELADRVEGLAAYLAGRGVGPGVAVGVCLEWRAELVVALLATLAAGGVYVPLDPALPAERLAYMAEDAGIAVLVTRTSLDDRVPCANVVRMDADSILGGGGSIVESVHPAELAYVIYTSGSTGRPKGVAVEHRAAAAHLIAMALRFGVTPADRVLQFASAGFDVSLEQVLVPLVTGAALVLRGAELWSPVEFGARAAALGVTVANLPPAYWREVAASAAAGDDALPGIRLLLLGGDALPAAAARAGGATGLANCYGPTEAVITATAFEIPADFAGTRVPIGRPIAGRAAYVLDGHGEPVPPGVSGELYLGGPLARGYLGRSALTAERFVPDPFGAAGGRLYRTGDRARWNADGELEFLGRTDLQVKIRGFRIEPGEIEARLRAHPAVREAVVAALEEAGGDPRLVAWVVADDVEAEALRAHLAESLPEYMVPAAYVRLAGLPVTPNGKTDRRALPAPDAGAFVARAYEAPLGDTETVLAGIWVELLRAERVGRWDDFFALGGHSLLAARVTSRVRQQLGRDVPLRDVFVFPVLADFARALEQAQRAALPPIAPAPREERGALSFAQRRLWLLERLGGAGRAYHMPAVLRLHGELDRGALGRALDRIVARHESLRTTFASVDGEPAQRIAPAEGSAFALRDDDLRHRADDERARRGMIGEEVGAPFHLEHGPLIRGRLLRLADDDHVLIVVMHHIVSDGWSMGVLVRELSALYAAFRRGEPDPLPPLPVQYADYAAWQRHWVDGEVLAEQAAYWEAALAGAPALLEL